MTQIYHTTQEAMHNNLRNLREIKYYYVISYDTMTL